MPCIAQRVSTDLFPERRRIAFRQEELGRAILDSDAAPLGDRPFRADGRVGGLPGLGEVSGIRNAKPGVSPDRGFGDITALTALSADTTAPRLRRSGGRHG